MDSTSRTPGDRLVQHADGSVTLRLEHPVSVGGETHGELRIRRPKARAWRGLTMSARGGQTELPIGALLEVLADCSGVTSLVIDELDTADMLEALEVVTGFLPAGLATGGA